VLGDAAVTAIPVRERVNLDESVMESDSQLLALSGGEAVGSSTLGDVGMFHPADQSGADGASGLPSRGDHSRLGLGVRQPRGLPEGISAVLPRLGRGETS